MTKEALERAYVAGAFAGFGGHVKTFREAQQAFDTWYQSELAAMGEPVTREYPSEVFGISSKPEPERIVEPFDFSKLPRPGDANYKPRGLVVGDLAGIEALFDEARADAIEEQEAANFAAFDPDKFVSPDEPAHMRGDDDN